MDDARDLPIDKGWAWMVVLGLFVGVFGTGGISNSFGILLEEFVDYFHVPIAIAALISGVSCGAFTLAAPLSVVAAEHLNQRKVVMFGGLVGALGLCLTSLMFNIEWVIFTYGIIFGIGHGCVFGNGLVMVGLYFKKRRGLATSIALTGGSLGLFAFPPLIQYMLDTYALRGTMLIIGGVFLNQIICGALYRPLTFYKRHEYIIRNEKTDQRLPEYSNSDDNEIKRDESNTPKLDDKSQCNEQRNLDHENEKEPRIGACDDFDNKHDTGTPRHTKDNISDTESGCLHGMEKDTACAKFSHCMKTYFDTNVLGNYVVIMFLIFNFFFFVGTFSFLMFMPATASGKGITKYNKAWLVSITAICDLVGRLSAGVIGDLNVVPRYILMSAAVLFCGLAVFLFSFSGSFETMCICTAFAGFFIGCCNAFNMPTAIDLVGLDIMPKVVGLMMFVHGLGATIGQPVLGFIRDVTGDYDTVHYISAACLVAAAGLLCMYPVLKKINRP